MSRFNRGRVASIAVVAAFSLSVGTLAVLHEGYAVADVDLNDGGVWVTNAGQTLLGHLNHTSQVLESSLRTMTADTDVVQDGNGVLLVDSVAGQSGLVDPASATITGTGKLNPGSKLTFRATTAALLDATTNGLYVSTLAAARGLNPEGQDPVAELGAGADVVVSERGSVFAVSKERGVLVSVSGVGADPVETPIGEFSKDATLSITTVGERPVVLDSATGTLYVDGRKIVVPEAVGGVLQLAGPANDQVVVESVAALVLQPLDGSAAVLTAPKLAGQGTASAPVWLAGCAYAVWSGTGSYVRDCDGEGADLNEQLDPTVYNGAGVLKLRQNRKVVVVNDVSTGAVWLISKDMSLVNNWESVVPEPDNNEQQEQSNEQQRQFKLPERSATNTPPVAHPDGIDVVLGVPAGGSAILPVLENDEDADGDLLTASLVGTLPPFVDAIEPVRSGAALQIKLNAQATGTVSFTYEANDGRGGKASAPVTVTVIPTNAANRAPAQKPTGKLGEKTLNVELGATLSYDALADWYDPDGDDLYLVSATSEHDEDDVTFRSNGVVQFRENVGKVGVRRIKLVVSDGKDTTEGLLPINIRPKDTLPPIANSDRATATAKLATTVSPLANDASPSGRPLTLSSAKAAPSADCPAALVTANPAAGTFEVRSDQPGTCYVQYLVTDGPSASDGLVRVDVVQPEANEKPPVAARDTARLPEGRDVLADVLANDVDPAGGILVVTSVTVPKSARAITAEVLEHKLLRIRQVSDLKQPVTITYTVSNGNAESVGEVSVLPVPMPDKRQAPVAVDDRAVVRAGDVVTIDVLANDYHPNDDSFTLDPTLATPPPAGSGELFAAEGKLRFRAGTEPGTVRAVYRVVDSRQEWDDAMLTIQVIAADTGNNSAPRPQPLTARVIQGASVRIPVPLDGIDPDGDSVELVGITSAPEKGRVIAGDSWLVYEAYPGAHGVDGFSYQVRDRLGAVAQSTVVVGIAPPPAQNQAPYTSDDRVEVPPGRVVSVPVLQNDSDPDGDTIALKSKLKADAGVKAEVQQGRIRVTAPDEPGDYTVAYTAADQFGAEAGGVLRLRVSPDATALAPIARDDRVQPAQLGGTSIDVQVLGNDEDPDGVVDALKVTTNDQTATVNPDNSLHIELLPTAQVVLYTLTDQDGKTGSAFVFVPGTEGLLPALRIGVEPLKVTAGQTVQLKLADYVTVRAGRQPLVAKNELRTGPGGDAAAVDAATISYSAKPDYYGPDAVSLPVTDGDPDGLEAYLSIPILVVPAANVPPKLRDASVVVELGAPKPVELNLKRLASDPDEGDLDKLTYTVAKAVPGVTAVIPDGGYLLQVSAAADSAGGELVIEAHDKAGAGQGKVKVLVTNTDKELPSVTDDVEPKADQGVAVEYSVLRNDHNPFAEQHKPLTIVDAKRVSGNGTVEITSDKQKLRVTPDASFVGTLVFSYTIQDDTKLPERQAQGTLTVVVQGRPDRPAKPVINSVGDQQVVLSWTPPPSNGRVIQHYEVSSASGPGVKKTCKSTSCTLDGLKNAVEYSFAVVAVNEIGSSDPSPASAVAKPDVVPEQPAPPALVFGDESLRVAWNRPKSRGSAVQSYDLEISPPPAGQPAIRRNEPGMSLVWTGLTNGTGYRVRVLASNELGPSAYSDYSAEETPARAPEPPGQPTTTAAKPVGDQAQTKVSWGQPANNGDSIKSYTLTVKRGGSVIDTIAGISDTSRNVTVDISQTDYTFNVTATNKAGESKSSPTSAPWRAAKPPGAVTGLAVTPKNEKIEVAFTAGALNGNHADELSYKYKVSPGGREGSFSSTGGSISGLNNGTSYKVTVWASSPVGNGAEATSSAVIPFGPVLAPSANASTDEKNINFSWAPPSKNGRDITKLEIRFDSGAWESVSVGSGSRTKSYGYSESHSITVRATDSEGQQNTRQASARTVDPPPPPTATVGVGNSAAGETGCTSKDCQYLNVTTHDFPPGDYQYSCLSNYGTGGSWASGQKTFSANGSVDLACWFGYHGSNVWVEIRNVPGGGTVTTPAFRWP